MIKDTTGAMVEPSGLWKKGDIIALLRPDGTKVTQTIRSLDNLMPLLSRDELKEVHRWLTFDLLMDPDTDPERRRKILSEMDVCPCCQRWLGHNRPHADDGDPPYWRQPSFDFKGKS